MAEKYENVNDGLLFNLFGGTNGTGENSDIEAGGGGGDIGESGTTWEDD